MLAMHPISPTSRGTSAHQLPGFQHHTAQLGILIVQTQGTGQAG